ncbi:hypothetical protein A0H81_00411 [Grifola frondosa]|uniref:Uncharacterized protein n=1 Tax=Grifola frondosa TaxID=5627 RepID=A0A1C7MR13_GRIFR|nr:hypothetical protein A0H81_00411 [Grifola frondosa]
MPLSKDTRLKWVHHFLRDCDESHGFGELGDVGLLDMVYLVNDGLRGIIAAQLADITFAQYSAKSMFIRRASHVGLALLKLVTFHAEAMSAGPERVPDEIKALAAAVKSLKDYKPGTAYLGSDVIGYDPEDNTVIIWGSLLVDIDNLLHHF